MTILGKLLTFVILVLSLVWNGLALNAYVTRTNWKAEADRQTVNAKAAADSANKQKALNDTNQEASEDAKKVLRSERDRYYDSTVQYRNTVYTLNTQLLGKNEEVNAAAVEIKKLQQNVDKLTEENKLMRDALDKNQKQLDEMTKSEESAKVVANAALLSSAAEKLRADRLAERVREQDDRIADLKRNGGKESTAGSIVAAAPEGFRGTVIKVEPPLKAGGDWLVTFTPGSDVGLKQGAELSISRVKPPKYIGKLVVLLADPKVAVAKFVPPSGVTLRADDYPKIDDAIVSK